MRGALIIVTCLVAAACATSDLSPRALQGGFATGAGVADPYADGKRHLATGRYEVAVERFAQALARDRQSIDALNGLAIAYTRLGRFDVAQTHFERALQIAPTDASTLNNYGWALIEQGRLREARPFLELALQHAGEGDAPVVAVNLESIGRARPPAILAALQGADQPPAPRGPHRLVRVDDNAYRLETVAAPAGQRGPATAAPGPESETGPPAAASPIAPRRADAAASVPTQDTGGSSPPAPADRLGAAEPERTARAKRPPGGGPIQLWPKRPPDLEAGLILGGD